MKTKISVHVWVGRIVGLIFIIVSLYNLKLNTNFFGFVIVFITIALCLQRVYQLKVEEDKLIIVSSRLFGLLIRSKKYKYADLKKIEVEKGEIPWVDVFLYDYLPFREPNKVVLTLSNGTVETHKVTATMSELNKLIVHLTSMKK